MEKNIKPILIIISILITLGVGFALGNLIKKNPSCPPLPPPCKTCFLDSKLTGNWTGYAKGELKEISGKDLTLTSGEETLKFSLLDGARIQTLEDGKPKEAKFEDIKIGQKIEIQFIFNKEKLFGSLLTILP